MVNIGAGVAHDFPDGWRSVCGHNTYIDSHVQQVVQPPLEPHDPMELDASET